MRTNFSAFIYVAVALAVLVTTGRDAAAQSAKATAKVADVAILTSEDVDWTTILENTIHTANGKDLFVDVSLECGLLTRTKVLSEAGVEDSSSAEGTVQVRVLLDPETASERAAHPGEVVYCRRDQQLSAKFAGIENCDENGESCDTTPEETDLVLETMNANSFNFILDDLSSGNHTVSVQARIDLDTDSQDGLAEATAAIGNGSVTVEEVRLVKGEDVI